MTIYKNCARCNDDMEFDDNVPMYENGTPIQELCLACTRVTRSIIYHGISLTKAKELTPSEQTFIVMTADTRCECCMLVRGEIYLNWRYHPDAQQYVPSWECVYCFHYQDSTVSDIIWSRLDVNQFIENRHRPNIKFSPSFRTCEYCFAKYDKVLSQHEVCPKALKAPFIECNLTGRPIDGSFDGDTVDSEQIKKLEKYWDTDAKG